MATHEVLDPVSGCAASSKARGSEVFSEEWGPKYEPVHCDKRVLRGFIEAHPRKMPCETWDMEKEEFTAFMKRPRHSSPGDDDIVYAFYSWCNEGIEVLWKARSAWRKGAKLPRGFNVSLLVFLEKDAELFSKAGKPTPASSHRPISLGNTDCKSFAASLAAPLSAMAPQMISEWQQGFIR